MFSSDDTSRAAFFSPSSACRLHTGRAMISGSCPSLHHPSMLSFMIRNGSQMMHFFLPVSVASTETWLVCDISDRAVPAVLSVVADQSAIAFDIHSDSEGTLRRRPKQTPEKREPLTKWQTLLPCLQDGPFGPDKATAVQSQ